MDIAKGEATEKELDAMIRQRHDQRVQSEGERAELEAWQITERIDAARKREQNRWEWVRYFDRIAACLRARAEEYDRRVEKLLENEERKETA